MNFRTTGRAVVAGLAIASALTMTACSDDSSSSSKTTKKKATATTSQAVAAPTTEQLNTELQKVLDPTVPDAEKLKMVQGMSADPSLPAKLTDAYKKNNVGIKIKTVEATGDTTANANAEATINGGKPNQAVVPFVYEDGIWKLEHTWACNALTNLMPNEKSPACTA